MINSFPFDTISAIHIPVLALPLARTHLFLNFFMFLTCLVLGAFLLDSMWLYFSVNADGLLLLGLGLASMRLFVLFGNTQSSALHT